MTIDFLNETDFIFDDFYISEIKRIALLALQEEEFCYECEISVIIVGNKQIKELNKKFRHKDNETDVLSFPSYSLTHGRYDELSLEPTPIILGDIVISIEKAKEQAKQYGHSLLRELSFLTCHSILHLLGYDHINENDENMMLSKQKDILNKAGITR